MNRNFKLLPELMILASLVAATGCIRADIPSICKGFTQITVHPPKIQLLLNVASVLPPQILSLSRGETPLTGPFKATTEAHLYLDSAVLSKMSQNLNLDSVERISVKIQSSKEGSTLPEVPIIEYERSASGANSGEIAGFGTPDIDLVPYLADGNLELEMNFEGTNLPSEGWTTDLQICFESDAEAKLKF